MASNSLLDSDSSDNENTAVEISEGQFVAGKVYHWGKLLTTPIGNRTIFKDVSKATVKRNCHLTVIMRHDEDMKHPSLPAEWKVQRILLKKFALSHEFINSWSKKEEFTDDFLVAIEKLPCIFTPDNLNEFEVFFHKYGHGFVKNAYVGGEVYLKISDKDNFDSIDYDSEEDPLLKMKVDQFVFRGGNLKYHKKASLQQWRESLYSNPAELILDQDTDVIFYHDFVPILTWLRNRRARGEALEEALAALEHRKKYFPHAKVIGRAFCTLQEGEIIEHSPILKITCMMDKFNVIRCTDQHLKKLRSSEVNKALEYTSGDPDQITVGQHSFVLKSFTSKCMLSLEFWDQVYSREDMFFSTYVKMVKALPETFSSKDSHSKKLFNNFFDLFGQGVIVSTYSGGEVEFKCQEEDLNKASKNCHFVTAEQVKKLVGTFDIGDKNALQFSDQMSKQSQYVVRFKGGNDKMKNPDKFNEWIQSLDDESMPLILDDQRDVILHQQLIRQLSWVKNAGAKADALEMAFKHVCLTQCENSEKGEASGGGAKGGAKSWFKRFFYTDGDGEERTTTKSFSLEVKSRNSKVKVSKTFEIS